MLKKKFFGKANAEKPVDDTSDLHDTDIEATEPAIEEIMEEIAGTEPDAAGDVEPYATAGTDVDEPDDELAALNKTIAEQQDKYLRLAAEFDNYRKRTLREKSELIQTAGESLLRDILPLVDDFERGIELASSAEDMEAVRTGMGFIYSKLKDFLTNHGVKEINAMNEPFDTDWHEAITNIPAPSEDMKGMIVDVIQKGYTLNNKMMRYPKVVVGE